MSKTILITGASTGIGAATAVALAEGNTLIVHYNASEAPAQETADRVSEAGGEAVLVQANLAEEAGCDVLAAFIEERFDKLDVLFNNVGKLVKRENVEELTWEAMEMTFALNVFSVMTMSNRCIPLLLNGTDPCIINNTSIAMRHGAPTATVYGAAKGALDAFTRGMAKELAPDIRVNAVAPGVIETPFHHGITPDERMEQFKEMTPLKKLGRAGDIASVVRMLVENTFMTGETIDVNGGLFMR